jgi:predicted DCC family thiol-disulfide oxidoreductase YuxK
MKLTIFYDGWCPYCSRFARWVKRWDWLARVDTKDIRQTQDMQIDALRSLKQMASIRYDAKVQYGFSSLLEVAKNLPVLYILVPFAYGLKIIGLGDFLYNALAIRRKIIPLHCNENCEIL